MLTTPTPLLGQKRSNRPMLTTEEKKLLAKEKRARAREARDLAQLEGWRDIDSKKNALK